MEVCEGDAPRPPVEAPWLFETDSPTQQKKVESICHTIILYIFIDTIKFNIVKYNKMS